MTANIGYLHLHIVAIHSWDGIIQTLKKLKMVVLTNTQAIFI